MKDWWQTRLCKWDRVDL